MLVFLVYNDNTHTEYLKKLIESVKEYGKEFQIRIFNKKEIDPEFYDKNKSIFSFKRGGGYWLWKPYIINKTLEQLNENDILLYLDSSYYFIEDFTELYKKHLEKNDFLFFHNKPNESPNCMKQLCKMDVIVKYDIYDKIFLENVYEYWAGCFFIKKTQNSIKILKEWLDMCCNYEDITDSSSKIPNNYCFLDHRHDQALLSILLHKNNIPSQFFKKKYLQNVRIPFYTMKKSI